MDAVFSKYVRRKHQDESGCVACFTCGNKKKVEDMHCGHFMSRRSFSTRWLHDYDDGLVNTMPQCPRCNLFDQNQNYVFSRRLDEVFGEGTADKVYTLSKQTKKFSIVDIVAMRKHYQKLLDEL